MALASSTAVQTVFKVAGQSYRRAIPETHLVLAQGLEAKLWVQNGLTGGCVAIYAGGFGRYSKPSATGLRFWPGYAAMFTRDAENAFEPRWFVFINTHGVSQVRRQAVAPRTSGFPSVGAGRDAFCSI
jgi:hypothetical protein